MCLSCTLLFCLTGRQAWDVQLCPWHDLRPHRMAFTDSVRHPPTGRAEWAQTESHLQDRLWQQVSLQLWECFIFFLLSLWLISLYPQIYPEKTSLVGRGQQCQSIENDRSSLSLRTNWWGLASANCTVFHHEMTALALSAVGLENQLEMKIAKLFSAPVMKFWTFGQVEKWIFPQKQVVISWWNAALSICRHILLFFLAPLHSRKIGLERKQWSRSYEYEVEFGQEIRWQEYMFINKMCCFLSDKCTLSWWVWALVNSTLYLCKVPGSWSGGQRQRWKHTGPRAHQHHQPVQGTRGSFQTNWGPDPRGEGKQTNSVERKTEYITIICLLERHLICKFFDSEIYCCQLCDFS